MNIGDLLRWNDKLWVVKKIDSDLATGFLESQDGERAMTEGEPTAELVAHPPREWPALQLPLKKGRLVDISYHGRPLQRFADWLKLDDLQVGGALYLNPTLGLGFGDRLTATYQHLGGRLERVPVAVPRHFRPMAVKLQELAEKAESTVSMTPLTPTPREPSFLDFLKDDEL